MDSLVSKIFQQIQATIYREQGPKIESVINIRAGMGVLQSGGTIVAIQKLRHDTSAVVVNGLMDAYEKMCKDTDRRLDEELLTEIRENIVDVVKNQQNALNQDMIQTDLPPVTPPSRS